MFLQLLNMNMILALFEYEKFSVNKLTESPLIETINQSWYDMCNIIKLRIILI